MYRVLGFVLMKECVQEIVQVFTCIKKRKMKRKDAEVTKPIRMHTTCNSHDQVLYIANVGLSAHDNAHDESSKMSVCHESH